MSKLQLSACAAIVIIIVALGCFALSVYWTPDSWPKQNESQEFLYLRDELLIESAEVLLQMHKRLISMEQDLIKIREKLTENNP